MVLDSIVCGPSEAEIVSRAVATHPRHSRHGWFNDVGRLFYTLDLDNLIDHAACERERERVRQWLDECRRKRLAIDYAEWLSTNEFVP
jgi:hypothetical protein